MTSHRVALIVVAMVSIGATAGYGALGNTNAACLFAAIAAISLVGSMIPEDF
jgi:hypothetical protein